MHYLPGTECVLSEIRNRIDIELARIGVIHRIFGRVKSLPSMQRKIEFKGYNKNGGKIQDVIGFRIVLYFPEDCGVVRTAMENKFKIDNISEDPIESEKFGPIRLNLVIRIDQRNITFSKEKLPVDDTFEVQIRTVLSEGWHEVEHDLRYKCKKDWEIDEADNRKLNGILASLETAEWAMTSLFDNLAYRHYTKGNWEAMLRHKYRVKMQDASKLKTDINQLFNTNRETAKMFWKSRRQKILMRIAASNCQFPWNYDNLVFLIDKIEGINSPDIRHICPEPIRSRIDKYF